jgi:hypothetical protein
VPASILGLVIAAFVALPGLAYYGTTGRRRPGESFAGYSPRIVASGLIAFLVAASGLALVGDYWASSPLTSAADLTGDAAGYLEVHTRRLVWTGLLLLGLSVGLAWAAGRAVARRPLLRSGQTHYADTDPWWVVLQEEKDNEGPAYAYADLRDGSSVGGLVTWFSAQGGGYGERDLVLMPWTRCVDELRRHGRVSPSRLRESLYHPDVHDCDVSLRLVVPGDQIARLYVRYVAADGTQAFRDAVERWGEANPSADLRCLETMGRTIVEIHGEERISIHRATGSVVVRLAAVHAADPARSGAAALYLQARGGRKLRRPRHTHEIPAPALLDDAALQPDFVTKVLVPVTRA